ncbi:hypothetical protein KIN20_016539 [Parelaphostrongylus tenuis]|uniref:Uncharacterized protein n=1 Tax=Parelaphostrongylus tenuis TaxID=148309 RepID=A0AAD5QQU7_PARTN|nr:hypothetical protein KIN20_016539 [Parelaphostrongylus tenuis]
MDIIVQTRPTVCTVEKCEISDQMQLFWEVYQLKVIPNLVDSSTLSALDKMLESVEAHIKEIVEVFSGLSEEDCRVAFLYRRTIQ